MGEIEESPQQPVGDDQSEVSDVIAQPELSDSPADCELVAPVTSVAESEVVDQALDDIAESLAVADEESVPTESLSVADDEPVATESLDDIAPETTHAAHANVTPVAEAVRPASVPWWPFLAYLGAWLVLTGIAVWQLAQLPAAQVAYESRVYGIMVLGGLIMTSTGPLLILAVWFAVWSGRSSGQGSGMLTSSLIKGALVTLCGALLWWVALIIVDYLRLGRLL